MQISLALPIVSEDFMLRTRLFSSCILPTEKASPIVTASGRPSGIATTTIVMPRMKALSTSATFWLSVRLRSYSQKIRSIVRTQTMINTRIATANPSLPIWFAIVSSLFCRGVWSPSMFIERPARPWFVLSPTARTTAVPEPFSTNEPWRRKGHGLWR